jgi:1-acyl-sn-glycerol-3-phosphate acyltransferase
MRNRVKQYVIMVLTACPIPFRGFAIALATFTGWIFGLLFTAVGVAIGMVAGLLGFKTFVRTGIRVWSRVLFALVFKRLHAEGKANIETGKGYLVVANHCSFFDIPAIMAVLPNVAWIGREWMVKIPLFGPFLTMIGYVPIDPESIRKARSAIDDASQRARRNVSVGIFPEGTRTLDGKMQRFKRGFIYLIRDCNLDVLPVTINGTYGLKPKNRLTMHPFGRAELTIHRPIANAELRKLDDESVIAAVRSVIEGAYRTPQIVG